MVYVRKGAWIAYAILVFGTSTKTAFSVEDALNPRGIVVNIFVFYRRALDGALNFGVRNSTKDDRIICNVARPRF